MGTQDFSSSQAKSQRVNMVEWSDRERSVIADIFASIDYDVVGAEALQRCLIVYPWTMRYFGNFGNLYNAEAIIGNPKIAAHGRVVLRGLDRGMQDLDNMKETYKELSLKHCDELKIDPDNFRLFADILTVVLASKMGPKFTAEIQAIFQKFLQVVVFSLGKRYH